MTMGLDQEFQCLQCGQCCKGEGTVRLSAEEFQKVCRHLGISRREALRFYGYKEREGYILFDKFNRECVFLRDNSCLIHEVKPAQCKDFPVYWSEKNMLATCCGYQQIRHSVISQQTLDK